MFFYRYRGRDGTLREIRLGDVGPLMPAKARDLPLKKRLEREQGKVPQLERPNERAEAKRKKTAQLQSAYTLENLIDQYIDEVLSQQKRGVESARILRRDLLPILGNRPALQITRRQLQDEVIRPKMSMAPRVATQLLCRIRCAYAHAIEQGRLPDDFLSPTIGIKGVSPVRRRRALTGAELAGFLRGVPHAPYSRTVRDALLLVLLTGCRSVEVIAALWHDVDFDRNVWTIRETKNGELHDVMLPQQAVALLKHRQGSHKMFVFPSRL